MVPHSFQRVDVCFYMYMLQCRREFIKRCFYNVKRWTVGGWVTGGASRQDLFRDSASGDWRAGRGACTLCTLLALMWGTAWHPKRRSRGVRILRQPALCSPAKTLRLLEGGVGRTVDGACFVVGAIPGFLLFGVVVESLKPGALAPPRPLLM